jgi:hypothetical protein
VTVAPYTFDAPADLTEAKARGAFLTLALIGTAIAWGEIVVASWDLYLSDIVPHPDEVYWSNRDDCIRAAALIRRWNRAARLP